MYDIHSINPYTLSPTTYCGGTREEYVMDCAEQTVFDFCEKSGIDFSRVSDTGTVDNLLAAGYTLEQVAGEEVPDKAMLDNLSMLD